MVDTSLLCDGVKERSSFTLSDSEDAKQSEEESKGERSLSRLHDGNGRALSRKARAKWGGLEGKVSPIPFLAGQEAGAL